MGTIPQPLGRGNATRSTGIIRLARRNGDGRFQSDKERKAPEKKKALLGVQFGERITSSIASIKEYATASTAVERRILFLWERSDGEGVVLTRNKGGLLLDYKNRQG